MNSHLLCKTLPILVRALYLSSVLAAAAQSEPPPDKGAPIMLKSARLFDGVSGQMVERAAVLVEGTRIVAVGEDVKPPTGTRVIDLGDATLLPGFIDCHVHLSSEMATNWYKGFYEDFLRFPAEQALYGSLFARRTLEAGFTTVRDVGDDDHIAASLRNAIRAGVIEGPRMLVANHAIGSTGGHADDFPYPPDRVAPRTPLQGIANGPEECRAAVRYQIKYGADVIKFMPSGGVLSLSDPVDVPELTQEEMNAIVSEAHAWHRKVAAHCHGDLAARMAIRAGVDSIEHGTFLADDTLREMKEKRVYLVPTLFAGYWVGLKADTFPPAIAEKARVAAEQMQRMFGRAIKIGVPVAFGTDAGVEPHGRNAQEFFLMVQCGMSTADALMAGTSKAADLLGVADRTGSLVVGKSADVVAVAGNPLAEIETTKHPIFVMKEGKIFVTHSTADSAAR